MKIELVREKVNEDTNAVPGKLFIDGNFFAYTLENDLYKIAEGTWPLYDRNSPKNGWKVHIDVPGRQWIMIHGGNRPEDSLGCVLLAKNRLSDSYIQGNMSNELYALLHDELTTGKLKITVRREYSNMIRYALFSAGIYLVYKLTK